MKEHDKELKSIKSELEKNYLVEEGQRDFVDVEKGRSMECRRNSILVE
jgi:hypothetical protein